MNFEKIKKKYPKAYLKYSQFLGEQGYSILYFKSNPLEAQSGFLFKFFDEQGIIINICGTPDYDSACEGKNVYNYDWEIYGGDEMGCVDDGKFYKSRQEAKQAALTKAFGILENK